MGDFAEDTYVEGPLGARDDPREGTADATSDACAASEGVVADATEGGRFVARLSPAWEIWGPNGGYLAAVALRAAGRVAAIPRPVSFSCHFLGRSRFDQVDLDVAVIRRGRSSESISVTMRQDGRAVVHAILRTAAEVPGLVHDMAGRPDVRPPTALRTWAELFPDDEGPDSPFWNNIEGRPTDPEQILAAVGADGGAVRRAPTCRQWSRFVPTSTFEDPFVDAARSVVLLDTMGWPAAARAHPESAYQAPNLDVVVWFHRRAPDSVWLLSDHVAPVAEAGTIGVSGRIWSERGRLIASGGAQLMCLPVPSLPVATRGEPASPPIPEPAAPRPAASELEA